MSKHFLTVLILFFFKTSFCQDINWQKIRIDSFLTASLPEGFKKTDTSLVTNNVTFNTKLFTANTEFATVLLSVMQTNLRVNPYDAESEQVKESYEGVKTGFRRKAEDQGFSIDMKDTTINNVPVIKANLFTDDHKVKLNRMCYFFCINSLTYSVITVPVENNVDQCATVMKQFINSIQFNKKEIVAHASPRAGSSSLFDKSEKVGELLGPVLLIAAIVIFFIYKSKKK